MKAHEYRDMSLEQLETRAQEEAENVMNMRMALRTRTLDNPVRYRYARRELARLKTVLHEKRRAAGNQE